MGDSPTCPAYRKNIGSFFDAATSADCCPPNWEELSAKLEAACMDVFGGESEEDTKFNETKLRIELKCRKPFSYWESSSFGKPPQPTFPIKKCISELEGWVKAIEEDTARTQTCVFKIETYFYLFSFLVLLYACVAYYLF